MAASLPQIVRDRAAGRCEYCRLPQAATSVPFEAPLVGADNFALVGAIFGRDARIALWL